MYQFVQFAATRAALAIITLTMVSFIVFSLMVLERWAQSFLD